MKFFRSLLCGVQRSVALFTRAWIEISTGLMYKGLNAVALFTRAWIEISKNKIQGVAMEVALFTRAWI